MNPYDDAIARGKARWGDKFTAPQTTPEQRQYFRGPRVEVTTTYDSGETFVRRGRISITTGWKPCLLLMHRTSDIGSWDTLNSNDRITAIIDRRGKRIEVRS